MNIKIADFAARYGISDRHARRLLADNIETLDGHYVKNTKGTWIDQYAAEFLYGLLRNPIEILPADFGKSAEDLQAEVDRLKEENRQLALNWANAENRANVNAGAVALLEAAESRENELTEENKTLVSDNARLEAQNGNLSRANEELGQKLADAEKAAQIEREGFIADLEEKDKKIQELENRTLIDYLKGLFRKN